MGFKEGGVWIDSKYSQEYHRLGSEITKGFPSHPYLHSLTLGSIA